MPNSQANKLLYLVSVMFIVTACAGNQPTSTPSVVIEPTVTAPRVTDTQVPTATMPAPMLVIFNPDGSATPLVEEIESTLAKLVAQPGLQIEKRQSLTPQDLTESSIRYVIVLPPYSELGQLASSNTGIQFLGIGLQDVEPAPNISLVRVQNDRADIKNFLAGYIAAVVTQDWRAGIISQAGDPAGKIAQKAFDNGMSYFCGLCQPVYPPYPIPGYPLFYEIDGASVDYQAAATYFKEWQVQTIYVVPPLDQDAILQELAQSGFNLIAERKPIAGLQAKWVASIIAADLPEAVALAFSRMLVGESNFTIDLALEVTETNPQWFSPGRQLLVNATLEDLLAGFIDTGIE